MAYQNLILTSIYGRRLGLQKLTTGVSGARLPQEFLVGPADIRVGVTTADTTSANLSPHGVSLLNASSVGSSQVYTLDPPVPGVWKILANSTNATAFIRTTNAVIQSSVGSTQTVIALPAAGMSIGLLGLTTGVWLANAATASGINLTNST